MEVEEYNYKYEDISTTNNKVGDEIISVDENVGQKYMFRILAIKQESDTERVFQVEILSSTDKDVNVGDTFVLAIPKHEPFMGVVQSVPTGALYSDSTTYSDVDFELFVLSSLKDFLDSRVYNNYKASHKIVLEYMLTTNVFVNRDKDKADKYLRNLYKKYNEWIRSSGGYVFSLRPSEKINGLADRQNRINNSSNQPFHPEQVTIDLKKLYTGIRLVFEAFGFKCK